MALFLLLLTFSCNSEKGNFICFESICHYDVSTSFNLLTNESRTYNPKIYESTSPSQWIKAFTLELSHIDSSFSIIPINNGVRQEDPLKTELNNKNEIKNDLTYNFCTLPLAETISHLLLLDTSSIKKGCSIWGQKETHSFELINSVDGVETLKFKIFSENFWQEEFLSATLKRHIESQRVLSMSGLYSKVNTLPKGFSTPPIYSQTHFQVQLKEE